MSCWTMRKKVITMKSYYPEETEHTYFETGEDGMFLLPEKLKPGTYYFREIEAPYGYLLGEDVAFEIREGHNCRTGYGRILR